MILNKDKIKELSKVAFKPIKNRVLFKSYDEIESEYNHLYKSQL